MSGEISVMKRDVKTEICAFALAAAIAFVGVMLLFRYVNASGFARGAVGAFSAYVLCRIFYAALSNGGESRRIAWELTGVALILDGETIPRETIKGVYCWPARDAFGHSLNGWTVNIETTGRNILLRLMASSDDVEQSAREMETLISALGGQVPDL